MSAAYKIRKATNNELYFVLEGENDKEILASEMYLKLEEVQSAIELVRTYCTDDKKYVRKTSNTGKPYFVLVGEKEEPIGTGEFYPSRKAAEKGIKSIKEIGPTAPVIDETNE